MKNILILILFLGIPVAYWMGNNDVSIYERYIYPFSQEDQEGVDFLQEKPRKPIPERGEGVLYDPDYTLGVLTDTHCRRGPYMYPYKQEDPYILPPIKSPPPICPPHHHPFHDPC